MSHVLVCPVCTNDVISTSSMCLSCHLPIRDVAANQRQRERRTERAALWLRRRLFGLVVYGAAVWWCWYQLPDALLFVGPGAVAAAWLHVVRGRPWLGLIAFVVIVGLLPMLFWPSMLTELLGDVTGVVD